MTNSEEFQRWTTLVNQIKALFKKKTLNKQKTIKVKNTEVAVTGLGTAAYEATTAFDAAGAADDVYNAIIALTNAEIDTAITNANSGT